MAIVILARNHLQMQFLFIFKKNQLNFRNASVEKYQEKTLLSLSLHLGYKSLSDISRHPAGTWLTPSLRF